jgi:hypothetical protein
MQNLRELTLDERNRDNDAEGGPTTSSEELISNALQFTRLEAYLRMSSEGNNLPVIFASGYSTDPAVLTKIDHPAASFLHKPYTPCDLGRKVWEALQRAPRRQIRCRQIRLTALLFVCYFPGTISLQPKGW